MVPKGLRIRIWNREGISTRVNGSRDDHCIMGSWISNSYPEVRPGIWPTQLHHLMRIRGAGVYGNEWIITDRHLIKGCCVLLWDIDYHWHLNTSATGLCGNAIAFRAVGNNRIVR